MPANNDFKKNGYKIYKNSLDKSYHEELFFLFYDLSLSIIKNNALKPNFDIPKNIKYNKKDLKILDRILIFILTCNNKLIGEIYDTIAYTSIFLRLVSDINIENKSRELLGLRKRTPLYSWTHRIRIDPPRDSRRTYGWHQEIFYTPLESKFLQTWYPVIRDANFENGTIEICPKSHKKKIADQYWTEKPGRANQIIVNPKIVEKYKPKIINMKLNSVLFFDPHLFHRSGNNTSDEIRFSVVGMLNDATSNKFKAPIPSFEPRTITPKKRYERFFKRKVI